MMITIMMPVMKKVNVMRWSHCPSLTDQAEQTNKIQGARSNHDSFIALSLEKSCIGIQVRSHPIFRFLQVLWPVHHQTTASTLFATSPDFTNDVWSSGGPIGPCVFLRWSSSNGYGSNRFTSTRFYWSPLLWVTDKDPTAYNKYPIDYNTSPTEIYAFTSFCIKDEIVKVVLHGRNWLKSGSHKIPRRLKRVNS